MDRLNSCPNRQVFYGSAYAYEKEAGKSAKDYKALAPEVQKIIDKELAPNLGRYAEEIKNAKAYRLVPCVMPRITPEHQRLANLHIDDCIKNPTIGLLARKVASKKGNIIMRMGALSQAWFNSVVPESNIQAAQEHFDKLYPKTGKLRIKLIENERVVLDKVNAALDPNSKALLFPEFTKKLSIRSIAQFIGKILPKRI